MQIRRGATPQTGKPTYFFTKATERDADESDYFFNLGYAYWLERDVQAAIYWLREAVRRNTADGDAHFVLGAALLAAGAGGGERAREGAGAPVVVEVRGVGEEPAGDRTVPRGLERAGQDLETMHGPRLDSALLNSAQREQRELAAFHLERGRRLLRVRAGSRRAGGAAEGRLSVALRGRTASADRPCLLRTGRPSEAIDALRIAVWSQETAAARVALAEALLEPGTRTGPGRRRTGP